MSIRLMARVFDSELPSTEKFVLVAMADYASDSGESIFPSVATLSKKTSLSGRAVQKSIQSLLKKQYLALVEERGGVHGTNLYRIVCDKFTEIPGGESGSGVNVVRGGVNVVQGGGERGSPNPLVNHQLTTNRELPKMNRYKMKVKHFPADTWGVLGRICELWKLSVPEKGTGRFKHWIKAGRELQASCGEFGLSLLDEVYDNWNQRRYMVSSPSSLVNSTIGIAGRKRIGEGGLVAPSVSADLSYHWNSDLSEEENQRLMKETIRKVQKGDQNEE